MASNTILTTACINLSLKVGTPRGLFLPFFFGMYTLFDGGLSCQYEHQFVITKDGPVILTSQGEERAY